MRGRAKSLATVPLATNVMHVAYAVSWKVLRCDRRPGGVVSHPRMSEVSNIPTIKLGECESQKSV